MFALVLLSIFKYFFRLYTFKVEMAKEKIAFIWKNKKSCNFCGALLASFMINTFSTSHLIKLFKSCSISG